METRTLKTRCKLCDARGVIHVTPRGGGEVSVKDDVSHRKSCPRYTGPKPQPKHFQKKAWVKQEKRANALVGARETLMSGAVNEDGDGRVFHGWRVESKQTKTDKFRLTHQVWEKLCKGALEAGEEPLLHIEVGPDPTRMVLVRGDWLWAALKVCDILEYVSEERAGWKGRIKVNGKGVTIRSSHIRTSPMWIEGMHPTPWLLTEKEFQELKRKADETNGDSV